MKEGAGARSLGALLWPPDKVARKSAVSVGTGVVVTEAAEGVGAGSVWAMHGVQARRARRTRMVAEVFMLRSPFPAGMRAGCLHKSRCLATVIARL
jgi:hypothetical protein